MIKFEDRDERNNIPNFEGMFALQKLKSPHRKSQRKGLKSISSSNTVENGKSHGTRNKQKNAKAFGRLIDFDFSVEDDVEEEDEEEEEDARLGGRGRRGEERGRQRDRGRDRKIAKQEDLPLILKITTLKSKTIKKFGSGSIPIKVQLAADVVDLSNSRNRRRGAVLISPAKAADAVLTPAVAYIGRKRDRERAERQLEKAEREKAEADAETKKFEEENLRAKEKKKAARKVTAESSVSVCAKFNNEAIASFQSADTVRNGAKKSKLPVKGLGEGRAETTNSHSKRKGSSAFQTLSSSSSFTTYPPSSLPPFLESVLRDDPLTAAIYQTFACDMIIKNSSDKSNKTYAAVIEEIDETKEVEKGKEKEERGEEGANSVGFSAIFSMAGLDCLDTENNLGIIGKRQMKTNIILCTPSILLV